MTPRWDDPAVKLWVGNSLRVLRYLPEKSVQCVVTSPPYFGLRDYQTATWVGGDSKCDHRKVVDAAKATSSSSLQGGKKTTGHQQEGFRDRCGRCGARRVDEQVGQEPTPAEYCQALVAVFREVRRVLRDDGTVFLNLGDSYNANGRTTHGTRDGYIQGSNQGTTKNKDVNRGTDQGLKSKDRLGIPHRAVFALQDDGWYWRDEIVWHNPSAMPESVTDRTTGAHEFVFLLTKSPRYYYDQDALREPATYGAKGGACFGKQLPGAPGARRLDSPEERSHPLGRNTRSVWSINPSGFSGAHFAVMPPKLVERCVKAGTSEKGCCPKCQAPWERVTEVTNPDWTRRVGEGVDTEAGRRGRGGSPAVTTTGWQPTCDCGITRTIPCAVLDPFSGAATTAMVADRLGRHAIGIDLSPKYVDLGIKRIKADRVRRLTGCAPKRPDPRYAKVRGLHG